MFRRKPKLKEVFRHRRSSVRHLSAIKKEETKRARRKLESFARFEASLEINLLNQERVEQNLQYREDMQDLYNQYDYTWCYEEDPGYIVDNTDYCGTGMSKTAYYAQQEERVNSMTSAEREAEDRMYDEMEREIEEAYQARQNQFDMSYTPVDVKPYFNFIEPVQQVRDYFFRHFQCDM